MEDQMEDKNCANDLSPQCGLKLMNHTEEKEEMCTPQRDAEIHSTDKV